MGYYVMVLDRKDNQKMDYLPKTTQELNDQEKLLSTVKEAVEIYFKGLNDEQKQIARDMLADLKGENLNQPDWSNTDYLKLFLEVVYIRGLAQGHIKGLQQGLISANEIVSKVINK